LHQLIIIVFPKAFTGSNADPYILEKLTTEAELSGLLNLALQGLKRLLKTGQFSYSRTAEETKEDYIRKSSPIAAFVLDCLETDSDAFIEKKPLYTVFAEYCRNLQLPTVLQDTFFKNLPKHVAVADYRPKVEGKRLYAFKGVRYSASVSSVSKVSRVFYTLVEHADQFKNNGYSVEELSDGSFIKIEIALDSIDTLDTASHKLPPSSGLREKLEEIEAWLVANRDSEGLVDSAALALKCAELGLDVQKTVKLLVDDGQIFAVPAMGKWGVK
jgi:phage/plasmid-associated DNA primase